METCSVVLTSESVDEILWCDHSNETSSAVLLHGTICFSIFYKIKFGIFYEFLCLALLGVKWLTQDLPSKNRGHTCPVSPARVVVKFTSEIIANPSGGSSGLGFRVVINNLNGKKNICGHDATSKTIT